MREIYRILDANFNRAREALRVAEDAGRFALNDPAICAMAKNMRSDLRELLAELPATEMLLARDTAGDIGTEITSPTEPVRRDFCDVATAGLKRLSESLRTIEEYCKVVARQLTERLERMRYNGYTLEQRVVCRCHVGQRFRAVRLYVVVTTSLCKGSLRETARQAIAGGADAVRCRQGPARGPGAGHGSGTSRALRRDGQDLHRQRPGGRGRDRRRRRPAPGTARPAGGGLPQAPAAGRDHRATSPTPSARPAPP